MTEMCPETLNKYLACSHSVKSEHLAMFLSSLATVSCTLSRFSAHQASLCMYSVTDTRNPDLPQTNVDWYQLFWMGLVGRGDGILVLR